jgi:hypothetical protein
LEGFGTAAAFSISAAVLLDDSFLRGMPDWPVLNLTCGPAPVATSTSACC